MIFLRALFLSLFSAALCEVKDVIVCPCGKTGANFTTFADKELQGDQCLRFQNCGTCRDNLDGCYSCPKGYHGVFCTKLLNLKVNDRTVSNSLLNEVKLKRQKRQYECPDLSKTKLVDIMCMIGRRERECTGTCAPGHHFQNHESSEITLRCRGGEWTPMPSFPPCISEGHCDLEMIGPGKYNCTTGSHGTACDVFCNGQHVGKYSCFPGSGWKPTLPYCIRPKGGTTGSSEPEMPECHCQNGGECHPQSGTCKCPPYYKGQFCELDDYPEKAYCNDPGQTTNGHRQDNALGGSPENGLFEEGSTVSYTCNRGFVISGPEVLTCQESGHWSSGSPICQRMRTPAPPVVTAAPRTCNDPGEIANGWKEAFTTRFTEGSVVSYYCQSGYELEGDSDLVCLANRRWSSRKPVCRAKAVPPRRITASSAQTCPSTVLPMNSEGKLFDPTGTESPWLRELTQKEYQAGTRIRYKCRSYFYKLYGSEYQTCQSSGTWSGYKPTCIPECGKSDAPKTPQIIRGNATEVGQWPWQIAIFVQDTKTRREEFNCGGSLLNERWIVTAAHCVTAESSTRKLDRNTITIYAGKYHNDLNKDDEYVQKRRVHQIAVHENYDSIRFDSDIALVELDTPVDLTVRVQPICLPTDRTTRENIRDANLGTVTGWGYTEKNRPSDTLLEAVLPVVSHTRCEESYRKKRRPITVTENMFCAGYEDGRMDSCHGDSGGPMMFLEDSQRPNRWILEGIVSWGVKDGCGLTDSFSGFVKVHQFLEWIKMTI